MAILKVCRMGHPVLRQIAKHVETQEIETEDFQIFVDDMIETMEEYEGVGLAAPQVHVGQRVVVIRIDSEHGNTAGVLILINPEIHPVEDQKELDWEGCLSIPDIRGYVPRYKHIAVSATDADGNPLSFEAEGFVARVIQHEVDHLDGLLFLDRMNDLKHLAFKDEYFRFHTHTES